MSSYPTSTAPDCPWQLPGCFGKIRARGAAACASCRAALQNRVPAREQSSTTELPLSPQQQLETDRLKLKSTSELHTLRAKYNEALRTIERQDAELQASGAVDSAIDSYTIPVLSGGGSSEATPVVVASDWHLEERVGSEVGDTNYFTLATAHERGDRFWSASLRLIRLLNQDVTINTVVLALLGDFITNDIHGAENAETNQLQPVHAILEAQTMITSGINFWLENSDYNLVITCHSGNHARTTITTRYSSENGHSLEYFMYRNLASEYRNNPRVNFIVPESPFSFLTIYDKTIRFHHGHLIKYGGGIGGLFIPAYKAISQYNKVRHADLDVFGHFHQQKDGGNFLTNGSLIGWNGFAQAIKADFEVPKQLLFLMDKKRGRTCTWPILLDK